MAKTKEQTPVQKQTPAQRPNPAGRYLREVRAEMGRVIWPTREQATNLTLIVLAVMVAMGVFLGVLDYLFGALVQALIGLL